MSQSEPLTVKDLLLLSILKRAGCETSIKSFQELENDTKALVVYQSKNTIRRQIYCYWHRDPTVETITADISNNGKTTSNKFAFWGATLWDFYYTYRIPSVPSLITISTGSRLSRWITQQGETCDAINKMNMISAENEEDPHEVLPFPISEVIEAQEMNIRLGIYGRSKSVDRNQSSDKAGDVFCPKSYPTPWPLLPFSYNAVVLNHYIPMYQLLATLIVHDPWGLLSVSKFADEYKNRTYDWDSQEDRTYLYHHYLIKNDKELEAKAKKEKTRRRLKALEDLHIDDPSILSDDLDVMLLVPSSVKSGPSEPAILVLHETAPDPKPAGISHLYLSPAEIAGEGNHSLVVNAEWEIPRSLVVPDILCYECILEDVHQTLLVSDGADGSTKDEKWRAKSGVWRMQHVGRSEDVVCVAYQKIPFDLENELSTKPPGIPYVLRPGNCETVYKYVGPVRPIKTKVKWQNGESYCSHILKRLHVDEGTRAHPLTAKVSVVAKLSHKGDNHLVHEFTKYEKFPRHFFEHWNGYNIVVPLDKPTPVGAVVPQYYGYYESQEDSSRGQYLSPIMLLENCGSQVVAEELNMDDRMECASLFFRLHNEGYIHQSVYPRNMLFQDGPLDRPAYQRGTGHFTEDERKHTFRLIDFGRTQKYKKAKERWSEEEVVQRKLNIELKSTPVWGSDLSITLKKLKK